MLGEAEEPARDRDVLDDALDEAARVAEAAELLNHQPSDEPIDFVAVVHEGEVMLLPQHIKHLFLAVDYQLGVRPPVGNENTF